MEHPRTLMEAVRFFADEEKTLQTAIALRWPNGVHCPTCGRTDGRFIATRKLWECKEKHARKQFSAKVGTIFEDSALPLDKWFVAIWSIANCKNGISSYELARAIGVTQKSAWHMLHRIRLAMEAGGIHKMDGTIEGDETFVGGIAINMHEKKRKASKRPSEASRAANPSLPDCYAAPPEKPPAASAFAVSRTPPRRPCKTLSARRLSPAST